MDDLSKILTSGYSPENFVKLSAQREQERQMAKRDPEVCETSSDAVRNKSVHGCSFPFSYDFRYVTEFLVFGED